MKRAIVALAMVVLLAGVAFAQGLTNYARNRQPPVIIEMDTPEVRARLIREWASSGEICRVLGHQWMYIPHTTLEYRSDGNYPEHRRCRICGKQVSREMSDWR